MYNNIIIVPYRNRQSQLDYFIKNISPLIKKLLPNSKIKIIEQEQGNIFNKGVLMNIGFKLFHNQTKYFIQNDIDLTPKEKCLKEYYNKDIEKKEVLAILTSPCNTYGGVIKICNDAIHNINGYPNDIWGWGGEDKALQNRGEYFGCNKTTIFIHHSKIRDDEYFKTFDNINDRNTTNTVHNTEINYNVFRNLNNDEKYKSIINNGLNTLKYNIIERKEIDSVTEIIKVSFNS